MRACAPPPACAEDVCTGSVPNGFRSCIVGPSGASCPSGPFSNQVVVVGASAEVSCTSCTACSVTQQPCGAGTVKFWGDANCTTQPKGSIAADGNCNATNGASGVNHFTYENQVQGVQCNGGTSTAAATLTAEQTVCCRP